MKWIDGEASALEISQFDQIEASYGQAIDDAVRTVSMSPYLKSTESNRIMGVYSMLLQGGMGEEPAEKLVCYLAAAIVKLMDLR